MATVQDSLRDRVSRLRYLSLYTAMCGDVLESERLRQRAIQMDNVISGIDPNLTVGVEAVRNQ